MAFKSGTPRGHMDVLALSFLTALMTSAVWTVDEAFSRSKNALRSHLQVSMAITALPNAGDPALLAPQIKAKDSDLSSVTYVSREDALQEAMKDPILAKSLVLLKDNPLPPMYLLQYTDRAWETRNDPTESLHTLPFVQEIRWDPQARLAFRALAQWRWLLEQATIVFAGVAFLWAISVRARDGFWRPIRARSVVFAAAGSGAAVGLSFWAQSQLGYDASLYAGPVHWISPLLLGTAAGLCVPSSAPPTDTYGLGEPIDPRDSTAALPVRELERETTGVLS